jgi:hypothetical protein
MPSPRQCTEEEARTLIAYYQRVIETSSSADRVERAQRAIARLKAQLATQSCTPHHKSA